MMATASEQLASLVRNFGIDEVRLALNRIEKASAPPLVIVCNAGLHPLPTLPVGADVFIATSGQIDLSSTQSVNDILDDVSVRLGSFISKKTYSDIYLVPFGHAAISSAINLMTFRFSGRTPKMYFHVGAGEYFVLDWDLRTRSL